MNLNDFKKRITNATANIVDATNFNDNYIKMIQNKEGSFGVILAIKDEDGRAGALLQGNTTGTVYVEYIEAGGLFRL